MSLSIQTLLPRVAAIVAGSLCALLASTSTARAQTTPALWPGIRMFRGTMILEANLRQQTAAAQRRAVAPAYQAPPSSASRSQEAAQQLSGMKIVISAPPPSPLQVQQPTQFARIRGPGGDVRRVPLAHGKDTIQPRSYIVRAGESITLNFVAAQTPSPKGKR